MKKYLCVFAFLLLHLYQNGISQIIKLPVWQLESGTSAALGKQTPFWLISNQYGLLTPNKTNFWMKTGLHSTIGSSKKIDYAYGIDLVNRYSNTYDIYFHQAYLQLKSWFFITQIGSKEEKFGNQDPDLSSGGLLWSGNARPMPKIALYIPQYTKIPFTKGFIEFKGGLSHGWFENNEYVKHAWLHHKYVYFQIGGKLPVHAHYGLHHYAQWGGESTDPKIGKLPSSWGDFLNVFMAKSGEGSTKVIPEESFNRIGNHLGSDDIGLNIDMKEIKISAYWQHMYEDGSGKAWRNIKDGLWGISFFWINNKPIEKIVFEYINTTDQSGPTKDIIDENGNIKEIGGNDNYFVNFIYAMGWSYHRMTIGTPLITTNSGRLTSPDLPINNKVKGINFGIKGSHNKLTYKTNLCYINNLGINDYKLDYHQISFYLDTKIKEISKWKLDLNIKIGIDKSEVYMNNVGFLISISKYL